MVEWRTRLFFFDRSLYGAWVRMHDWHTMQRDVLYSSCEPLRPCTVNEEGTDTIINKYSWNEKANVIFLDQVSACKFPIRLYTIH